MRYGQVWPALSFRCADDAVVGEGASMRFAIGLAVLLCCAFAGVATASAEKRVALVIGNADYKIGRLANPVNDAEAVAEAFKSQLKFDQVILRKDLKFAGLREALREMARASAGAELGVVFFAGHGIEVGGRNYLIPTDAALAAPADIELEAIPLDTVLRQLDGITKLRLVILDACRNNPFPAVKRGATRGLGRVEPDGGTLIAYAAKDGTTADDGKVGRHSPFTVALLKRIVTPGLDIRRVFGYVSEDVLAATGRAQEPYLYGRLGGDEVHLIPVVASVGSAVLPAPVQAQPGAAAEAWDRTKDTTSIAVLETYIRRFGDTYYGDLAKVRLAVLKKAEDDGKAGSPRPGHVFRDCTDICPEMVVVPAGEFTMGSDESAREKPPRRVTIQRPFAVGKFEVMFAEWDACVADGGCNNRPSDEGWGRGRRPVINVSWHDAKEYVGWLSRKTGKNYRLLSEAEWEYAARAGTRTRYAFGDTISKGQAHFFTEGSYRTTGGKTVEVGSFPANGFGLHDMHGNVWEWVEDAWHPTYHGAPVDGSVWAGRDVSQRVLRSGFWCYYPPHDLRSATRCWLEPGRQDHDVGFRVGRTL
jgi:formylglycine-generating enzyme required for sulfatase activity